MPKDGKGSSSLREKEMAEQGKGRGRGRGRGRAYPPQQQQPQGGGGDDQQAGPSYSQGRPGGQQRPVPPGGYQTPTPPGMRAPAAQAQSVTLSAWGPPRSSAAVPPPQQPGGRGSRLGSAAAGPSATTSQTTSGHGGGGDSQNRGGGNSGVRGRANRNEIINTRPGHATTKQGVEGTLIELIANYFPLSSIAKWSLYQYRVDFLPEVDDTKQKKGLVYNGMKEAYPIGYLFDGTVLYSSNRIQPEPLQFVVKDLSDNNIQVNMRLVGEVLWGDWHYLQLFNIVIRKCLVAMKFQLIGRNYFDTASEQTIRDSNLSVWSGFLTAMRQYERRIMLNVDLSFKVLRTDTVFNVWEECLQTARGDIRGQFQSQVIGMIVLTRYNNKTYRIDDVDFSQNPDSKFKKRDGTEVSYRQYFADRYRISIRSANQPMLVSRSKPREIRAGMPELVILVPELCTMTGLTDQQRSNFMLMNNLNSIIKVNAGTRLQKLQGFCQRLEQSPEAIAELKRWGFDLEPELIKFKGRVLPQQSVKAAGGRRELKYSNADWTFDLRSGPVMRPTNISNLVVLTPGHLAQATSQFVQLLIKTSKDMAISIESHMQTMQTDNARAYLVELDRAIARNPSMVLVILSNNSADRYNAIKKKCYVDTALPCQVVVGRTIKNPKSLMSIATKVSIQMNCKMGGAPWGLSFPNGLMIVGYDVCRDTANRSKSFAGMVASLNDGCTEWYSLAFEQEVGDELCGNIGSFLVGAVREYHNRSQKLPSRIVIYRDGVGEGQIGYVKDFEVAAIKQQLTDVYYKTTPLKMAFIVVSKRINTKIFRKRPAEQPKTRTLDYNPPSGTVVDDHITWPERYDFYLVSQCVRQGTVAPTSYNIIDDNLGVNVDKIQMLTYRLCHMYYNWTGTIRVPAPCQYAHKLAFITAQSLHRVANTRLSTSLYYL